MLVVWQHESVVHQGVPDSSATANPGHQSSIGLTPYSTTYDPTIRFDPSYIKTLPGYLKIAQGILDLVGYICIELSGFWSYDSRGKWFNFVAMTGFSVTEILFVLYLFHIPDKLSMIPWIKFEFGFCIIWVMLYFIASLLVVLYEFHIEAFIAAGFFGFCAMTAYGIDAVVKYQAMNTRPLAQANRETDKGPTPTVTSPLAHP